MTKRLLDDYWKLSEYLIQPIFSDYKERDWKYIIHKYIDVPRFVIWMNVVEKIAECLEQWVQMHGIQNSTIDQAQSSGIIDIESLELDHGF